MENTEFVDVGKRIEELNTEMRSLDLAAVFPLGGIILARTLKRYLSPEAVEGDGEVRVDGETVEALCERLGERIVRDREGFDEWIKEHPEELEAGSRQPG
jgi:hypothetical protein